MNTITRNCCAGAMLAALLAGCASAPPDAARAAALDAKALDIIKRDFQPKGIATLDRLDQDEVQKVCTEFGEHPPPEVLDKYEPLQRAAIVWPADGKYMGDWKAGEKLAQSGRGMTWSDKPEAGNGGNCYNCHQLSPDELSFGTIGPSLTRYGRNRGRGEDMQRYAYGKIYNAKAYNLCSNMPRFGHFKVLDEQQIKDLVAYLLDPASPVNK